MTNVTKTISADDRLKYIAMMTVALEHERMVRAYGLAISRLLGIDDAGTNVTDAIYGVYGRALTVEQMYDLLRGDGISVDGASD